MTTRGRQLRVDTQIADESTANLLSPNAKARSASRDRSASPSSPSRAHAPASPSAKESKRSKAIKPSGRLECRKLLHFLLCKVKDHTELAASSGAILLSISDAIAEDADDLKGDWLAHLVAVTMQLRDVLVFARERGWNLLSSEDGDERASPADRSPSAGRGRTLFATSPPPSPTLPQPTNQSAALSSDNLLSLTLDLLSRLTLIAANYRVQSFRPALPPLALQSVVMDIAAAVRPLLAGRLRPTSQFATALLPGIERWASVSQCRLLDLLSIIVLDAMTALQPLLLYSKRGGQHDDVFVTHHQQTRIHVQEATEDLSHRALLGADHSKPSVSLDGRATTSTFSGGQPVAIYRLAALVPLILDAALQTLSADDISTISRHKITALIVELVRTKRDLHLDLLHLIAYGRPSVRQQALAAMQAFWPGAMGHYSVTKPLNWMRSEATRVDSDPHQWAVWRYEAPDPCMICRRDVKGFGLKCLTGAHAPLHLECLNSQSNCEILQYTTPDLRTRIGALRFSLDHTRRLSSAQREHTSEAHRHQLCRTSELDDEIHLTSMLSIGYKISSH